MKILLDECIDRRLAREFIGYEIKTVPQMGWAGIKDLELLVLAAAEFDVFVTADRNLSFQQNLSPFDLSLIVLKAQSNRLTDLKPLVPKVLEILNMAPKGQATLVSLE
jgi:predicted nuclease of predicted toxin-antitoxin system